MKNAMQIVSILCVMMVATLTAMSQQNEKVRKQVGEVKKELTEAKLDSAADFQRFNAEVQMQLADNDKIIADIKAKKPSDDMAKKKKYDSLVSVLEKTNSDLKTKLSGSSNTKTENWVAFKRDVSREVTAFGKSLKEIWANNTN